jgi:predicted DNA-binding transcriptional regulator YafY
MLAAQASGKLTKSAEVATEKIAHILPPQSKANVQELVEIVHFYLPREKFDLEQPYLLQIQQAIKQRRTVYIRYHSYLHNEVSERVIEPQHLTYSDGAWYVDGYCRLREDHRSFRLERIESLSVLNETFVKQTASDVSSTSIEVRVRFNADAVRWVRERQHYAFVKDETVKANGDVVMCYTVKRMEEIRSWLLGWGTKAEALAPLELRKEIRDEAKRLVEMLT